MREMPFKLLAGCICLLVFATICFAEEYHLSAITQSDLEVVSRTGIELVGAISSLVQKHEKEMPYETQSNLNIVTDKLLVSNAYMLGAISMLKIENLHYSAGQVNREAIKVIKDYLELALRDMREQKDFVISLAKQRQDLTDEQKNSIVIFYNEAEKILKRVIGEL